MGNLVHHLPPDFIDNLPWTVPICGTQTWLESYDATEDLEVSSIRFMHVYSVLRMDGL